MHCFKITAEISDSYCEKEKSHLSDVLKTAYRLHVSLGFTLLLMFILFRTPDVSAFFFHAKLNIKNVFPSCAAAFFAVTLGITHEDLKFFFSFSLLHVAHL